MRTQRGWIGSQADEELQGGNGLWLRSKIKKAVGKRIVDQSLPSLQSIVAYGSLHVYEYTSLRYPRVNFLHDNTCDDMLGTFRFNINYHFWGQHPVIAPLLATSPQPSSPPAFPLHSCVEMLVRCCDVTKSPGQWYVGQSWIACHWFFR